ncbi:MAG: type II toxin-antitoxin system RelE/ParE family toxin [Hyphomonadaceae bacterium]
MKVVWDDEALDDLDAIGEFISRDNSVAARRVVERIRDTSRLLETSPRLGKPIDERTRELILRRYPYVLVYEIAQGEVRILAVFHHAQNRS